MCVKIVSITLLLLSVHLCCHASPVRRHPSRNRPCCTEVSTLDVSPEVVGQTYHEQAAAHLCVKAVIFNTDYGKICADPEDQWVKNLVANMTKV